MFAPVCPRGLSFRQTYRQWAASFLLLAYVHLSRLPSIGWFISAQSVNRFPSAWESGSLSSMLPTPWFQPPGNKYRLYTHSLPPGTARHTAIPRQSWAGPCHVRLADARQLVRLLTWVVVIPRPLSQQAAAEDGCNRKRQQEQGTGTEIVADKRRSLTSVLITAESQIRLGVTQSIMGGS